MNTFYMLALSGCISEGNTMEEAERNIIEAIEFTLNLMKKEIETAYWAHSGRRRD